MKTIAHRGIHPKEAMRLDDTVTGEHDLRGKEDVVLNHAVVTDMISTPQHYVISNSREWLKRICLQNETIIADRRI